MKKILKTKNRYSILKLWLLLVLAFSTSTFAQSPKPSEKLAAKVETFQLNSKLMARQMPYRVVFPTDYDTAKEKRYAVVYLLHGLTGHFDNWTDKAKLAQYAAAHDFLIVTPEGANGWYTDSATQPNERYETYITDELIPEIDKKFRTLAVRENRFIAGLSMGGYGSLKFGLKYPEKFLVVGSFSGALGAASWNLKTLGNLGVWKALTDSITSVYGADESPTRAANDIFKIAREVSPEKVKSLPFIYLDCGTEDFLISSNRDFSALLLEKKIPHEFRQLPGAHNWVYWDAQVQEFLRLSERAMNKTKAKAN